MDKPRFRDFGESINEFADNILVECPRCKRCTKMTWAPNKSTPKFVCQKCGLVDGLEFSDVNLWLMTSCCGNILWAYNKEHLDFLERYVSAYIREQVPNINQSLASRLPTWIKSAKNRNSVLKCINKLRRKLNDTE